MDDDSKQVNVRFPKSEYQALRRAVADKHDQINKFVRRAVCAQIEAEMAQADRARSALVS